MYGNIALKLNNPHDVYTLVVDLNVGDAAYHMEAFLLEELPEDNLTLREARRIAKLLARYIEASSRVFGGDERWARQYIYNELCSCSHQPNEAINPQEFNEHTASLFLRNVNFAIGILNMEWDDGRIQTEEHGVLIEPTDLELLCFWDGLGSPPESIRFIPDEERDDLSLSDLYAREGINCWLCRGVKLGKGLGKPFLFKSIKTGQTRWVCIDCSRKSAEPLTVAQTYKLLAL